MAAAQLAEANPAVADRARAVVTRQLVHLSVLLDDLVEISRLTLRTSDLHMGSEFVVRLPLAGRPRDGSSTCYDFLDP